jgi:hypothetical protein
MPFPVSIAGTIAVSKDEISLKSTEQTLVRIEDMLDTAAARTVAREGRSIKFTAGLFRLVGSWNILVSLNSGIIEVSDTGPQIQIVYKASTVQLLVTVSTTICVMGVAISTRPAQFSKLDLVWPLAIMGAWLFGANYLITRLRFRRWLERGIRRVERQAT